MAASHAFDGELGSRGGRDLFDVGALGGRVETRWQTARGHTVDTGWTYAVGAERLGPGERSTFSASTQDEALATGEKVRYAGAVISRQRPGTAKGVVFLTLEDETGFVNVVIWSDVWKRHALTVKTATLLGVSGKVQSEDGVAHVIAESFWVPRLDRRPASTASRGFR